MTDRVLLRFSPFFDCCEDDLENLFRDERIAGKHRPILDVVETQIVRGRVLQHDGPADNSVTIRERDPKILESARVSKIDPPGGLHETRFGCFLQEAVPGPPSVAGGRLT